MAQCPKKMVFENIDLAEIGIYNFYLRHFSIWCTLLSPQHGRLLGCGWRTQLPDMDDSCEYTE
jgi:hypothetical protein